MGSDVYILGGARTPFATWARGTRGDGLPGGALKDLDPFDLGAAALKAALARTKTEPAALKRVVFGYMYQAAAHSCYGSRYVALRAGVPENVPAPTVGMACGSGLYALLDAASAVREGDALVATGGTDNISTLPKSVFVPSFHDVSIGKNIGEAVEESARERGIGRDQMDAWSLRSHTLARAAQDAGRLADEIVAVGAASKDDAVQEKPAAAYFAEKKPMFGDAGWITALNTHGLVDGASALILSSQSGGALGRLAAGALIGLPPSQMGLASVPAIGAVVEKAGWKLGDVDLFEINETFAAQVLLDIQELGLDPAKVNVNGGAIALGHPFAATGAKLVLGLLLELRRRKKRRGIASICIGGGQGVAVAVEAV